MAQMPTTVAQLSAGGGVGGVGGEGLGGAVTDPATAERAGDPHRERAAAGAHLPLPVRQDGLARGMLAPLLMWTGCRATRTPIQIDLKSTSGSFSWSGTFARPAILMHRPPGSFIRHPIPQDVWAAATNTAERAERQAHREHHAWPRAGWGTGPSPRRGRSPRRGSPAPSTTTPTAPSS